MNRSPTSWSTAHQQVYVERNGQAGVVRRHLTDDAHVMNIATRIVKGVDGGSQVDAAVDARLADARASTSASRRRPSRSHHLIRILEKRTTLDVMEYQKNLSPAMATVLKIAIALAADTSDLRGHRSGKTTLANACRRADSTRARIVTIEDAAELQLQQPHGWRLETAAEPGRGGEITQRDLVKNTCACAPRSHHPGEIRAARRWTCCSHEHRPRRLDVHHTPTARARRCPVEYFWWRGRRQVCPRGGARPDRRLAINLDRADRPHARRLVRRITQIFQVVGMEGEKITIQDSHLRSTRARTPTACWFVLPAGRLAPPFPAPSQYYGLDRALWKRWRMNAEAVMAGR
jgi:pilus assembly protein CpaF